MHSRKHKGTLLWQIFEYICPPRRGKASISVRCYTFFVVISCLKNKLSLATYQKTFWVLCCFYARKTACMEFNENEVCLWKTAPRFLRLSCSTVIKFVLLLHLQHCCCLSLRAALWWDREFHLKKNKIKKYIYRSKADKGRGRAWTEVENRERALMLETPCLCNNELESLAEVVLQLCNKMVHSPPLILTF